MCMCVCVCVSRETGLGADRVFRVEPISQRDGGLWALSVELGSSSAISLPLLSAPRLNTVGPWDETWMQHGAFRRLWFPFKISPDSSSCRKKERKMGAKKE